MTGFATIPLPVHPLTPYADGKTICTAAYQAWLDSPDVAPSGEFLIDGPLNCKASRMVVAAGAHWITVAPGFPPGKSLFNVFGGSDLTLQGIGFDGGGQATNAQALVTATNSDNLIFRDCAFRGHKYILAALSNCQSALFDHCSIDMASIPDAVVAVWLNQGGYACDDVTFRDCTVLNGRGYWLDAGGADRIVLLGNRYGKAKTFGLMSNAAMAANIEDTAPVPAPPTPAFPPTSPAAPSLTPPAKRFFYFTAKPGDLAETRDHVTDVWYRCWGDPSDSVAQTQAAQMPVIMDVADVLFDGTGYRGDQVAEQLLRAKLAPFVTAGLLPWVQTLYLDEPPYQAAVMAPAIALARRVVPGAQMMATYNDAGGWPKSDYHGCQLFDFVACDAYNERARIADPNGRLDQLAAQLRPDQRYFIVAGVNTEVAVLSATELGVLVTKALGDARCGGMMLYTWFDRTADGGGLGARSNGLAPTCIAAGMKFKAWNAV